jgi:uncharacterized phage protein (TIGR02220 family)
MVSPQKGNGYVGIANEIWDEVIRRDFTKRQKDILLFILRLSYGCGRKVAHIPMLKDFSLCGVGKTNIKKELHILEQCAVIFWDQDKNEFRFNKDYSIWQVSPVREWDLERFRDIIHVNLVVAKQERKVIETITSASDEKLSNQEPKVIETITIDENQLLKQELTVIETITVTTVEPNQGAASEASKKGLKKEVIKESLKNIYAEIISYLNQKTGKKFSPKTKNTIESINGRMTDGYTVDDFKYVIDVKTAEWLNDPKNNQYLCPETLFRPSKFEKYLNQSMPLLAVANETGSFKTPNDKHYERNKLEAEKIREAIEREGVRDQRIILEDQ